MSRGDAVPPALLIILRFPDGVYRGGDLGLPEELPSPARVHAAFVSAAAGGPAAANRDSLLCADPDDHEAVAWLEDHPPFGVIAPEVRVSRYDAVRHRVRAAVDVKGQRDLHRDATPFEPLSCMASPLVFAWPPAPPEIRARLASLANEITHVGRADSVVIVHVAEGDFSADDPASLQAAAGRGPGRELRVPEPGRWNALIAAHREAMAVGRNRHGAGARSKQAKDEPVATAGERATRLVRFAPLTPRPAWPYGEAWLIPLEPAPPAWTMHAGNRVRSAVAVHRAVVAAIGEDVPDFITGRDGDGPLRGDGHLSIQFVPDADAHPSLLFGVPPGIDEADRARLLDSLAGGITARIGGQRTRLGEPRLRPALAFWPEGSDTFATSVPLIVDAPGKPRNAPWTLDDAVVCSVGYALRGALEADGVEWGAGWDFRRRLVAELHDRGVRARGFRIHDGVARFAHRAREGELLVAAHAIVRLGPLGGEGRGLLALGRARHLGGGLLRPLLAA